MQRIEALTVQNQRVFVRLDLEGVQTEASIKRRILPVLDMLLLRQATVILAGHDASGISFAELAASVSKVVGKPVVLVEPKELKTRVQPGGIFLIENLHKYEGELKNDAAFAELLAASMDIYVSDCPAAIGSKFASILRLAQSGPSAAGPALFAALTSLQQIQSGKHRPTCMILGGVDLGKKAEMFGKLLRVTDQALVCGSVGLTFLKARLIAVGTSIVEPQQEVTAFQLQEKSELEQTLFAGPVDHVIAERFTRDAKTKTVKDIPDRWMALDIGPKTVSAFEKHIKNAKSILWYGTAGAVEVPAFQTGTLALLKAASKSSAHILFIGRDTCRMAEDFAFKNASFLPASEPALEILSGKIPAGLQILQKEI